MERILYTKYSNERAERFQIRTDIVEIDGKRYARKSAFTPQALNHIDNIYKNSKKLDVVYKDSIFVTNSCEKKDEALYFEYLEGNTFEQKLDKLLAKGQYMSILTEIENFFSVLKDTMEFHTFQPTEEFKQVFGDIEFPQVLQAAAINNIDYIFGNIFIGDSKWTIIDYEWTFDFPIPFLYIVYRAVHYYTFDESREKLRAIGMLRVLGITTELEQCFQLMEHRLQLYILGGVTPVVNMYDEIAGSAYKMTNMLEKQREESKNQKIQVYYCNNNGFSEENSVRINPVEYDRNTEILKYNIPVNGSVSLRIDPADYCCIVHNIKLYCEGAEYTLPDIETNGVKIADDIFVFATQDPMMIISNVPQNASAIKMTAIVTAIEMETAIDLVSQTRDYWTKQDELNRLSGIDKQLEETKKALDEMTNSNDFYKTNYLAAMEQREALKREKAHVENLLSQSDARYREILNSTSVKITKPLRYLKKLIKKLLKSNKVTYKCARGIKCLKENGPVYTVNRTKEKIYYKRHPSVDKCGVSMHELEMQRAHVFTKDICFSITVPLYNTPEKFLREMIESVQEQTYPKWELCLADGSDADHSYVGIICLKYASKDSRIRYKKLERNEGISENTNRCLEMATGNYIALFDHDDLLHPSALYENMCVIEKQDADFIYSDENTFSETPADAYCPHYKPDFSPDTLRSYNYICHFSVFKRSLLDQVGMFRKEFDGSQDYDMILRLTEKAKVIVHIPKIIYFWRAHAASVASNVSAKTYCMDAAKKALDEHLKRVGLVGKAVDASIPSVYKIQYEIMEEALISILIPNKDFTEDLSKCINSILEKSTYTNYEIIVIENNSELEETFEYYKEIEKNPKVRVVYWKDKFNYSAINNFGFSYAKGEYILLLNNDMEVITPDWMQEMLMFAQRTDVGAVGAKLYYPDDTVQHAGVILGIGGVAGHSHKNFARDAYGYSSRLQLAQNLSAVTAACMLMSRSVYEQVGGLDESFEVAFNDIDLCMKIRKEGYLIVFTPFAELYHYESKSRGYEDSPEKVERFNGEIQKFYSKWDPVLEEGDPYYNPNLTLKTEDFAIKRTDEGRIRA